MLCVANGTQLDCGWTGGGQGRAVFQRQASGVLAGTYGDFLSTNSRGAWDLRPSGASPAPAPPAPPAPPGPPAPAPPGPPSGAPVPLAGNYQSTRGPMTCTENGAMLACTFTEQGAGGRLDCQKDASGMALSCTWLTFFPRPGTGRAAFTRSAPGARTLTGTWGHLAASSGAGAWEMQGQ